VLRCRSFVVHLLRLILTLRDYVYTLRCTFVATHVTVACCVTDTFCLPFALLPHALRCCPVSFTDLRLFVALPLLLMLLPFRYVVTALLLHPVALFTFVFVVTLRRLIFRVVTVILHVYTIVSRVSRHCAVTFAFVPGYVYPFVAHGLRCCPYYALLRCTFDLYVAVALLLVLVGLFVVVLLRCRCCVTLFVYASLFYALLRCRVTRCLRWLFIALRLRCLFVVARVHVTFVLHVVVYFVRVCVRLHVVVALVRCLRCVYVYVCVVTLLLPRFTFAFTLRLYVTLFVTFTRWLLCRFDFAVWCLRAFTFVAIALTR